MFKELVAKAHEAGMKAGREVKVTPMVLGHAKSILSNEIDYSRPLSVVTEGVCGSADIKIKGNTAFGRWAKKEGIAHTCYGSGLQIWVNEFGQSMTRSEAYAQAYAKVLNEAGIEAFAKSRMD